MKYNNICMIFSIVMCSFFTFHYSYSNDNRYSSDAVRLFGLKIRNYSNITVRALAIRSQFLSSRDTQTLHPNSRYTFDRWGLNGIMFVEQKKYAEFVIPMKYKGITVVKIIIIDIDYYSEKNPLLLVILKDQKGIEHKCIISCQ